MMMLLFMLSLDKITYAAGYIPNIQFAPLYVAIEKGYYEDEGIELKMDYTIGPDVLKLVALGKIQLGSTDPDAFLNAVERGIPLVHVATLYQTYPVALITKNQVEKSADLKGKRIGISGAYGSSYLALRALLNQLNLKLSDIDLRTIGYTQVATMKKGLMDGVMGYENHEPVLLESEGMSVNTLQLNQQSLWPGVGIMTSETFFKENPLLVQRFLKATFRGVDDLLKNPEACFQLVVETYFPQVKQSDRMQIEKRVLMKTLPYFQSEYTVKKGLGQCDPDRWCNLHQLMVKEKMIPDSSAWKTRINREFMFATTPEE
ncbi:MAG: hypothetical protein CSA81_10420 [Acidobacteria bacterium]|nr:MAG: hypothetical protein CSA81_10420 [Acidobacteriota bacterium]